MGYKKTNAHSTQPHTKHHKNPCAYDPYTRYYPTKAIHLPRARAKRDRKNAWWVDKVIITKSVVPYYAFCFEVRTSGERHAEVLIPIQRIIRIHVQSILIAVPNVHEIPTSGTLFLSPFLFARDCSISQELYLQYKEIRSSTDMCLVWVNRHQEILRPTIVTRFKYSRIKYQELKQCPKLVGGRHAEAPMPIQRSIRIHAQPNLNAAPNAHETPTSGTHIRPIIFVWFAHSPITHTPQT